MTPGSDLLSLASTVICQQKGFIIRTASRQLNDIGQYVDVESEPEEINGHFQAVNLSVYQQLKLDFKKRYLMLYTSNNIESLYRDKSSDFIIYNDRRYGVVNDNDWAPIDGWTGVLLVQTQ